MNKPPQDSPETHWNPEFFRVSPLFDPLVAAARQFHNFRHDWPGLTDFQHAIHSLHGEFKIGAGKTLRFVDQGIRVERFEQSYEPRIYLEGEIQTRTRNWHDFFQVLVWCTFPLSKRAVNIRHYHAIESVFKHTGDFRQRDAVANALTQFDECGAIIASSDKTLLDHVINFRWKRLFTTLHRNTGQQLQCYVFGHAMYEKALHPYIGMTAPALLIKVTPDFFTAPLPEQIFQLDRKVADIVNDPERVRSPQDLTPFPLLGMPGWYDGNEEDGFYDNRDYFRPGRRRPSTGVRIHTLSGWGPHPGGRQPANEDNKK